jgi:hypothetical protein
MSEGGGEVDRPGLAQHPDGEVAQAGHDVRAGAGADLAGVLGEGGIPKVVERLDRPVPTQQVGQPGGAGLVEGEAGDRIDGHGPPSPGPKLAGPAGDLDDLRGVREPEVVDGDGLEGAQLDATVAAVAGAVSDGDAIPGQTGAAVQQRGLVGLDGEQVVGLLAVHEELGGLRVGLQRVGGDHGAGEVEAVKQRGEGGDLTRRAGHLALGQHRAGGVVHGGQQMDLPAAWGASATQGLAVDRDRPSPLVGALPVAVGQPCADRGGQGLGVKLGKGAADRGFAGDRPHPVAGARIAAGSERGTYGLGCVGGPLGDRGDRPGARQDRSSGQHQDGDQRVTAPGAGPWVGDSGQVGGQVRCLGWSERISVSQYGQAGWDRG